MIPTNKLCYDRPTGYPFFRWSLTNIQVIDGDSGLPVPDVETLNRWADGLDGRSAGERGWAWFSFEISQDATPVVWLYVNLNGSVIQTVNDGDYIVWTGSAPVPYSAGEFAYSYRAAE